MAKILLVEDDNNLREIYEARLQAEGYEIVTAPDGETALVVAKKELPDLVISDVMMPRVSGFEMLDILRNTEGLKHVRIIMLTALGQAEDKTRADTLGADKYLVKSQVTLEDIVKAAKELLGDEVPAPTEPAAAAPAEESAATAAGQQPAATATAPTAQPATLPPAPAAPAMPTMPTPSADPAAATTVPATDPAAPAGAISQTPAQPTAAPEPAAQTAAPSPAPVSPVQPMFAQSVPAAPAPDLTTPTTPTPNPAATTPAELAAPASAIPEPESSLPPSPTPAEPTTQAAPADPVTVTAAPAPDAAAPATDQTTPSDNQVMANAINDLIQGTPGAASTDQPADPSPTTPTPDSTTAPADTPANQPTGPSADNDDTDSSTKKVIQPLDPGSVPAITDLNELMTKEGHVLDTVAPQENPLPNNPGTVITPSTGNTPGPTPPNSAPTDHSRIAL